ncbi:MAG: hypothetical protein ACOC00_08610 [Halothiobacillaceae bacterium]
MKVRKTCLSLLLAGLAVLGPLNAGADELEIRPAVNNAEPGEALFVNGLGPSEVRARFGEPVHRVPAVGEPPISAWEYPDMTVYFEHELALHAVLHRKQAR